MTFKIERVLNFVILWVISAGLVFSAGHLAGWENTFAGGLIAMLVSSMDHSSRLAQLEAKDNEQ